MTTRVPRSLACLVTFAALFLPVALAAEPRGDVATQPVAAAAKPAMAGSRALDSTALSRQRGGSDVFSDLRVKGVVADNQASHLTTGNNLITDGAFTNANGMPMVVQNSGNNVLIQSATVVNVQVK